MGGMNRQFLGRRFFIAAYALIAIGFLTFHLTRVKEFSAVIGSIVVEGRASVGTVLSPPQIRRLGIRANGLRLTMNKSNKAVLVTDDGIRHPMTIERWEQTTDGITVYLDQGASFSIQADPRGTDVLIIPSIPATRPPVRSLELPFAADSEAQIVMDEGRPSTLSISVNDQEFEASLPSGSSWNPNKKRLNLVVLDKADPILRISDDQRGGGLSARDWLAQGNTPSEAMLNGAVNRWLTNLRNGWKSRLDSRSGLWSIPGEQAQWNDVIASSQLADSVAQGNYATGYQEVLAVADRAPRSIGWLPSPYLGNIVDQSRNLARSLTSGARTFISAMDAGRVDFSKPEIIPTLFDAGFADAARRYVQLAQSEYEEDSNQTLLNRIELLQDARETGIANTNTAQSIRNRIVNDVLIPRLVWVQDGLWLIEEDGSIHLQNSIQAGIILIREAQWNNDGNLQIIGRQLVISGLAQANQDGTIPQRLLFEGDGSVQTQGTIIPETFFANLAKVSGFPRRISLSEQLGNASWAITAAERFTLRSTPRETTITVDFPAGSIHHMAIKGVKPFNRLIMNEIRWNGDPNFQRYHSGWYYDAQTETLHIKKRHRTKSETIRILYYDAE